MIDFILISLLQAAAGDPGQPAQPPAPPAATESAAARVQAQDETAPEDRVRCRREAVLGTRMTRRVCTTERQDREMEREARDLANRAQGQMGLQGN